MTPARAGAVVGMFTAAVGLALAFAIAAAFGLLKITSKGEISAGIAAGIAVLFVYAGVVGAAGGRALLRSAWFGVACWFGVGAVLVPAGLGGFVAGIAAGDVGGGGYVTGPLFAIGFVGSPVGLLLGVAWALVVRRHLARDAAST